MFGLIALRMNKFYKILAPVAAALVLAGCAQEKTTSTGEKAREYLDLYMATEFPDLKPDEWGIYVMEETPGTGDEWNSELGYSYLTSTIRSLDGLILSSTDAEIAKQLDQDTYKAYNYYGPRYQGTASGSGYAGLEYILKGMKTGGKKTAIIPAWLLTTSRYSTKAEYIAACTSSTHLIYSVGLEGQCSDIAQKEILDLREYVTQHFGEEQQSCIYKSGQAEGTFYFVSDTTSFAEEDKRASDATLYIKYTGRRLDGQAFDTNDQDIALAEGLYTSDRTYSNAKVVFSSTYGSITMNSSSSLIDGFKGGLYKMHWVGQKATVLFVSDLGYSSTGSGDLIPPYAPLIFELELLNE